MKQMWRKKKLLLGSQKNVIEFADLFHFALPFLVVVQPLLHHHPLFWPNTELAIAAARIGYGQYQGPMPFSRRTTRAAFTRKHGSLDQRSP